MAKKNLSAFLVKLATDAKLLARYRKDPAGTAAAAGLSAADRAALAGGDATTLDSYLGEAPATIVKTPIVKEPAAATRIVKSAKARIVKTAKTKIVKAAKAPIVKAAKTAIVKAAKAPIVKAAKTAIVKAAKAAIVKAAKTPIVKATSAKTGARKPIVKTAIVKQTKPGPKPKKK